MRKTSYHFYHKRKYTIADYIKEVKQYICEPVNVRLQRYRDDLVCSEGELLAAQAALATEAAVVCDVEMVAAGITKHPVVRCWLRDERTTGLAADLGITRSAAAVHLAVGPGAVWVIGCAPTALFELLTLNARLALVIGLPVGFVGAADAKAALRSPGLPAVSNRTKKGASVVVAAASFTPVVRTPARQESPARVSAG